MFEQLLYEYIKENFKVEGFNLSFGYGEIHPHGRQQSEIQRGQPGSEQGQSGQYRRAELRPGGRGGHVRPGERGG